MVSEQLQGKICGVVTDRDLVTRVLGQWLDASITPVEAVMTPPPIAAVFADTNLCDAERVMLANKVRRLLVRQSETDSSIVGVLSIDDFAMTGSIQRAGEVQRVDKRSN